MSPNLRIQNATVIGAGTMGAQIAAVLANNGIPVLLLDVAAPSTSKAAPGGRNQIVREQFERMRKLSPSPLYTPEVSKLITLGNIDDDLAAISRSDWIVEAAPEVLEIKQSLHAAIAKHASPTALISTNTSGIPVFKIAKGLPPWYVQRFFATHFFNPPRYMHLLEVVAHSSTDLSLFHEFIDFAKCRLGKGVVVSRDTPCFIANRIGCFDLLTALHLAEDYGLEVEQVDALTGPLIGRPMSGTFRLCDIVGVDLLAQLAANLRNSLVGAGEREAFTEPDYLQELVRRGLIGEKRGGGFYKRISDERGKRILSLDLKNYEYRDAKAIVLPSFAELSKVPDLRSRMSLIMDSGGVIGEFLWAQLSTVLCYVADHFLEFADDVASVDDALKWGYRWELGPFELWDTLGVSNVVRRLEKEGRRVPPFAASFLAEGNSSFYKESSRGLEYFNGASRLYDRRNPHPREVQLARSGFQNRVIVAGATSNLIDLGDGIACFEFNAKMNVIGQETLDSLQIALEVVDRNFQALVIGNQGKHFSVGANLKQFLQHIESGRWNDVDRMLTQFQSCTSNLRRFRKPVVAAIHGYTLGGGCEFALGCDHIVAHAETNMGLPETGVGLIPGAHGTKELLIRYTEGIPRDSNPDYFSRVRAAWETIGQAKMSTCASDAAALRYLREGEWTMVPNLSHLIGDAKAKAIQLCANYQPPVARSEIPALGLSGIAQLKSLLHALHIGGKISEHDKKVGIGLARVLCGGELTGLHYVNEGYLLELEREVFLSLCGEQKTIDRIRHTLATGKPLKN